MSRVSQGLTQNLAGFIAGQHGEIEEALRDNLPLSSLPAARRLNDALRYAVFPGGKRLRNSDEPGPIFGVEP